MSVITKPEDKPKVIILCSALVVVMGVIGYMIYSASLEQVEAVEAEKKAEVSLMLPPPTAVSGAMLLWNVERDAGPDPFRYVLGRDSVGRSSTPSTRSTVYTGPTFQPDERPVQPGIGQVGVQKSVVLKAIVLNLNRPERSPVALIEIEGNMTTYRIGQSIMPGVKIKKIDADGITLDVNGEESYLGLDQSYIPGNM